MTGETVQKLLAARPFKPFRIAMSSGDAHEVRYPEMALVTKGDILVAVDEEDDGVPADFQICALLYVTAVEPLSPSVP
jgi:hypothetical protein